MAMSEKTENHHIKMDKEKMESLGPEEERKRGTSSDQNIVKR